MIWVLNLLPEHNFLTGFEAEFDDSLENTELFYLKYGWRLPIYLTFVAYCPALQ